MMSLQRLTDLAPPAWGSTPREYDWESTEADLGFPLPDDYKLLVSTYGPGIFGEFIYVYQPEHPNEFLDIASEHQGFLWALQELKEAGEDIPYRVDESPELLTCGRNENGDPIFWHRNTEDPNSWDIVVMEARGSEWFRYHGNLTDFLSDVLSGSVSVPIFPSDFPNEQTSFTAL